MPVILKANQGEQDLVVKIEPKTAKGKPAQVQAGSLKAEISSGEATLELAADGLSFKVISGPVGKVTGKFSADADLSEDGEDGSGIKTIEDTFELDVVAVLAENLGASGEIVDKV